MAGEARAAYSPHAIDFFNIISINRTAPAVAEVDVFLRSEKKDWSPRICFVRIGGRWDGLLRLGSWKMDGVEMGR